MGQLALGFRSLLIKAAIFVVMAALLAWALGGTLWPRPSRAEIFATSLGGLDWYWRVSVYDHRAPDEEYVVWELIWRDREGTPHVLDNAKWYDIAGPVRHDDRLYFGGRRADVGQSDSRWMIYAVDQSHEIVDRDRMPDRLAVEQQLERLEEGLALQDEHTILLQRPRVLDPEGDLAEEESDAQ